MIASLAYQICNAANDDDPHLASIGEIIQYRVMPQIIQAAQIDLSYQFTVFASALELLGDHAGFRLERQCQDNFAQKNSLKYNFSFATDPDAFMNIEIRSNAVYTSSFMDCDIPFSDKKKMSYAEYTNIFNSAFHAFECIKEFIEEHDPEYNEDTVLHIAKIRDRLNLSLQ